MIRQKLGDLKLRLANNRAFHDSNLILIMKDLNSPINLLLQKDKSPLNLNLARKLHVDNAKLLLDKLLDILQLILESLLLDLRNDLFLHLTHIINDVPLVAVHRLVYTQDLHLCLELQFTDLIVYYCLDSFALDY
jgi:hypothetical protein